MVFNCLKKGEVERRAREEQSVSRGPFFGVVEVEANALGCFSAGSS